MFSVAKEQKTAPPPPFRGLFGCPSASAPDCVVIQTSGLGTSRMNDCLLSTPVITQ